MKRSLVAILIIVLLLPLQLGHAAKVTLLDDCSIQVYFSPGGGCTDAINKALSQAKEEVLVQASSFTSAPIAQALLDAHKRGVGVQVILDKGQKTQKYSSATFLNNSPIPTFIDDNHAKADNKIIIIDREIVITGSFDFTKASEEKNAENLLIIKDKGLAKVYVENWEKHQEHSKK